MSLDDLYNAVFSPEAKFCQLALSMPKTSFNPRFWIQYASRLNNVKLVESEAKKATERLPLHFRLQDAQERYAYDMYGNLPVPLQPDATNRLRWPAKKTGRAGFARFLTGERWQPCGTWIQKGPLKFPACYIYHNDHDMKCEKARSWSSPCSPAPEMSEVRLLQQLEAVIIQTSHGVWLLARTNKDVPVDFSIEGQVQTVLAGIHNFLKLRDIRERTHGPRTKAEVLGLQAYLVPLRMLLAKFFISLTYFPKTSTLQNVSVYGGTVRNTEDVPPPPPALPNPFGREPVTEIRVPPVVLNVQAHMTLPEEVIPLTRSFEEGLLLHDDALRLLLRHDKTLGAECGVANPDKVTWQDIKRRCPGRLPELRNRAFAARTKVFQGSDGSSIRLTGNKLLLRGVFCSEAEVRDNMRQIWIRLEELSGVENGRLLEEEVRQSQEFEESRIQIHVMAFMALLFPVNLEDLADANLHFERDQTVFWDPWMLEKKTRPGNNSLTFKLVIGEKDDRNMKPTSVQIRSSGDMFIFTEGFEHLALIYASVHTLLFEWYTGTNGTSA